MTLVERAIEGLLQERELPRPKAQVSARIPVDYIEMLDAIAERLNTSRSGLAGDLLEAGIVEAGQLVGIEMHQDANGHAEVMLFVDPREGKS